MESKNNKKQRKWGKWDTIGVIITILFVLGILWVAIPSPFSPRSKACGIENCHGLDIKCGSNIPDACTEIYEIGDGCRKYAKCESVGTICRLAESPEFQECKTCVEKCIEGFKDDAEKQFSCENKCVLD